MRAFRVIVLFLTLVALGSDLNAAPSIIESKFELFVTNVKEATRFYTTLGFVVAHQKPDGYTTLQNGSTVVALSPVPLWLPLRWLGFLRYPPLGTELVFYSKRGQKAPWHQAIAELSSILNESLQFEYLEKLEN